MLDGAINVNSQVIRFHLQSSQPCSFTMKKRAHIRRITNNELTPMHIPKVKSMIVLIFSGFSKLGITPGGGSKDGVMSKSMTSGGGAAIFVAYISL